MKRLILLLATLTYLASLLWAYATIISPNFAYYGYQLIWPGPISLAWLIMLAALPIAFLPLSLKRPSGLIVWWMYLTVYVPSILMPTLSLTLTFFQLLPLQVALLLCMALLTAVSRCKVLVVPRLHIPGKTLWPVIFFLWVASLAFVCAHFNFSTLVLNLASLFLGGSEYTIRNGFFEQLSQTGRILGYTTGQVGEALDPFFIAYGLVYRRKWLTVAGVAGQFIIFAVLGAKSILFSSFFIVLIFLITRFFRQQFGLVLCALLVLIVWGSAAGDAMSDGVTLSSITTRRTLMDPGLLTGFYFEHYSHRSHAGLAYHFPQGGEAVPAPSYEIGLVYFGDEHIDANANLWAEGFADFGIPGVFGFTLLLALMMWGYDSVAAPHSRELAVLLVAMQAFAFSNAAPLTTVITHGGLASALLLWCSPSGEGQAEPPEWEDFGDTDAEMLVPQTALSGA